MKISISFKTPDAVSDALDREFGPEEEMDEENLELFEQREAAKALCNKFVRYGEYVTVVFDTETNTATVKER